MKRCPKCNKVFEDDKRFCQKDGSSLIIESAALPSEFPPEDDDDGEFETVIRTEPIKYDFPNFPLESPKDPEPPVAKEAIVAQAPSKPKGNLIKYLLILVIGLIIGSVLVMAVGVGGYFYLSTQTDTAKTEKPEPETREKDSSTVQVSKDSHAKRNKDIDESKLNGKVIKLMVHVRSGPSRGTGKVGTLPKNDRLIISKRKDSGSPWFQIECEHGTKGWMHGNTIAFIN